MDSMTAFPFCDEVAFDGRSAGMRRAAQEETCSWEFFDSYGTALRRSDVGKRHEDKERYRDIVSNIRRKVNI
jgi:hypothetical protein